MESIRLGGPGHTIKTKTVCKTLPGVVGGVGGWVGGPGVDGSVGSSGVQAVSG